MKFTLDKLIACAEREVKQRKKVYARLVADGRMDKAKADEETAMMEAIRDNLKNQKEPQLIP